jgi:hypothetical protein
MTLDASGNLGVGTTSPSSYGKLAVNGNIAMVSHTQTLFANKIQIVSSSGDMEMLGASANILFKTGASNDERLRITSGGFFKASNTANYVNSTGLLHEFNTDQNDTNTVFRNTSSTLTAQRSGIDVLYSAASPNNTSAAFYQGADNGGGSRTLRFEVRSNGGIANYQANDANLSDERTKKDITPLESYWDKFRAIEIVKFKYKDQTHDDFNIGVIAQQVESVAPEFVDVDGWGDITKDEILLKSIYTSDLHHATIKVLQEAMSKIEILQAEIEQLKNK